MILLNYLIESFHSKFEIVLALHILRWLKYFRILSMGTFERPPLRLMTLFFLWDFEE